MYPIEVKSSKNYTTTSLLRFKEKFSQRIGESYIIHPKNLAVRQDGIICLSAYMTFCLWFCEIQCSLQLHPLSPFPCTNSGRNPGFVFFGLNMSTHLQNNWIVWIGRRINLVVRIGIDWVVVFAACKTKAQSKHDYNNRNSYTLHTLSQHLQFCFLAL